MRAAGVGKTGTGKHVPAPRERKEKPGHKAVPCPGGIDTAHAAGRRDILGKLPVAQITAAHAAFDHHVTDSGAVQLFGGLLDSACPGERNGLPFIGKEKIHIPERLGKILEPFPVLWAGQVGTDRESLCPGGAKERGQIFRTQMRGYKDAGQAENARLRREREREIVQAQAAQTASGIGEKAPLPICLYQYDVDACLQPSTNGVTEQGDAVIPAMAQDDLTGHIFPDHGLQKDFSSQPGQYSGLVEGVSADGEADFLCRDRAGHENLRSCGTDENVQDSCPDQNDGAPLPR